jgi:hypothetical protein
MAEKKLLERVRDLMRVNHCCAVFNRSAQWNHQTPPHF